jgi:DNA repair protein RadA/Sms
MALKARPSFACQSCGHTEPRWFGRCPACGEWNTAVSVESGPAGVRGSGAAPPRPVTEVEADGVHRLPTGIGELDRVLGGGVVPGSLVLVAGDPGVGKSTLLLQAAAALCRQGATVVYASGEESVQQIRLRADRLGALDQRLLVSAETDLAAVCAHVEACRPAALIVDSIQTATCSGLPFGPGSLVQVREGAMTLLRLAKRTGVPVLLVGHINKTGAVAGPKVLEHAVDAVLVFEGERHGPYRLLRSDKNRFGSTDEIGVFQMADRGLEPVDNPSRLLLSERASGTPGSVVFPWVEGTRCLLVEVQALLAGPAFGSPRRTASGVDGSRLALLLAVLERRCGLRCGTMDAYVKVSGGVRVDEPGVDLAVALALASCVHDRPVDSGSVAWGEVGLGGEVRAVGHGAERLHEAVRLGFRRCIVPPGGRTPAAATVEAVPVASVAEAIAAALGSGR